MSLLVIVEAFLIRRRARLAFCLMLRARGLIRNLFLAFAPGRRSTLLLFLFFLNNHHMIGVLFNVIPAVLSIPCNSATIFSMPFI
jgi:uncharacterized membrane protein